MFSLDGSRLGVLVDGDAGGTAPWLFRPPPIGRITEAYARAKALEDGVKFVCQTERHATPIRATDHLRPSADPRSQDKCTLLGNLAFQGQAPASDSTLAPTSLQSDRAETEQINKPKAPLLPHESNGHGASGGNKLESGSALGNSSKNSAMCLSRIRELSQVPTTVFEDSVAGSDSQQTTGGSIDARLLNEARDGQMYKSSGSSHPTISPLSKGGGGRHQDEKNASPLPKGAWDDQQPPPKKTPTNLRVEQQRKYAKRTRSTSQFLVNSISRTKASPGIEQGILPSIEAFSHMDMDAILEGRIGKTQEKSLRTRRPETSPGMRARYPSSCFKEEQDEVRDDSTVMKLEKSFSAPALRHAEAMTTPTRALMKLDANHAIPLAAYQGGEAGDRTSTRNKSSSAPLTQSTMVTPKTERSATSTNAEFARRLASDRRRRRMDDILDGVRRIGQQGEASPILLTTQGEESQRMDGEEAMQAVKTDEGEKGGATVIISTRVSEVLSRFENFVSDQGNNQGKSNTLIGQAGNNNGNNRLDSRQREVRIAARQAAIKHNERYRRAQRFNLVTLQETQQRRHEAMVGLTGPSGERFGPYTLDDVLEFQAFVCHLSAQGAEYLTVRGLMENPGIQADPYAHALLQELVRSRVLQWNQSLALEDLLQV